MRKNNKPVRSENVTWGQFFIKGLVWSEGSEEIALINNCFGRYTLYMHI